MLGAYFDESYGRDSTITAVLGCVSDVPRWVRFERAWRAALAPWGGLPFHASEWAQGKKGHGRFKKLASLNPREQAAVERGLRRIVDRAAMRFVFEAVIEADYQREIVARLTPESRTYKDSYYFCVFSCLTQIQSAKRKRELPLAPVHCFFEGRGEKDDKRLVGYYDYVIPRNFDPQDFGACTVGPKGDPAILPTEAADFILYYIAHELEGAIHGRLSERHGCIAGWTVESSNRRDCSTRRCSISTCADWKPKSVPHSPAARRRRRSAMQLKAMTKLRRGHWLVLLGEDVARTRTIGFVGCQWSRDLQEDQLTNLVHAWDEHDGGLTMVEHLQGDGRRPEAGIKLRGSHMHADADASPGTATLDEGHQVVRDVNLLQRVGQDELARLEIVLVDRLMGPHGRITKQRGRDPNRIHVL